MICGFSDRDLLPPYIIYKAEREPMKSWTLNGLHGIFYCTDECCNEITKYTCIKLSLMNMTTFLRWFNDVFLLYSHKLSGKTILCGDSSASHFSSEVI